MTRSIADLFETMDYGPAPEAATPAIDWLERHQRRFTLFIDGRWVEPQSNQFFETINPAHKQTLAQVAQAGAADVEAAVQAARKAFSSWSITSGHVRARYLYALARQVQKHSRFLAVLETLDNGKPIRETRDIDIPLVARHFYYHAGWAQLMESQLVGYQPLGVVGQIIPWNFPLLMLAWKIAPALAMGNTLVLKPAEFTPLTALAFAEIVAEVGLPPGVVNILTGDGRTGELIVQHADINKIAFTGSTEVGRRIRELTAGTGKRLSLELGGKSPFLVFDDADLDSAVEGVVDAIWFNQGQVCCAGSRLLVQESIAERFIQKLQARMETLRVGDPLDKAIDIGAIIAPVQLQKIEHLVKQGVSEGATLWQPSWACPQEGYFFPPTLFTNVAPASIIAQVEIFGPVLVSMPFRTPAEAIALANNTCYGLAASIWSENISLALDLARQLKAGTVWINSTNLFDAASGFGGYRESGFGREGAKEGLWEYLQLQGRESLPVSYQSPGTRLNEEAEPNQQLLPVIDRTAKLFIGGKQVRPDSGNSRAIYQSNGTLITEVGEGNRKDIRNAVEAAHKASTWSTTTAHARAQIIYYLAENLAPRSQEFAQRLCTMTGCSLEEAHNEVEQTLERLFFYAAWADKYEGAIHQTPMRNVTLAIPEPLGVLAIVCPNSSPLLAFVALLAPAIALGNSVVIVPSEQHPLSATDFYQVIETSDVPAGVINIVTGQHDQLAQVLAEHADIDGIWYFGSQAGSAMVERASIGNLKRTWVSYGKSYDWFNVGTAEEFLRHATQIKNIWLPYGV